jgi:4-amino-4-deoxy-L-arabinose transferase-like glycosyltransferase
MIWRPRGRLPGAAEVSVGHAPPASTPSPARIAWVPVLAIAAAPLLLHLFTAGNYGIFRDEYYYLACARRLAWGYVDQPPLSIALLASLRAVFGDGILALRLVPAVCASAMVVLAADIATRLGGGRFAQILAAVTMSVGGVMLAITGFYSMNALDLVFWAATWALLARWAAAPSPRLLLWLGVLLGLGLMNKIGLLLLGAALAIALPLTPLRRTLRTPGPYLAGGLVLVIVLPHVLWQMSHGWPTLEFIANAQRGKIVAMAPLAFIGEVVLEQHPASVLVWVAGLIWLLFAPQARPQRLLGFAVVIAGALLMLQRAKPYYAAGLFPVLFASGACAWEAFTSRGRRRTLRPALLVLLAASGVFLLPLGVPILPVEAYARWQQWTGIAPAAQEVGHTSVLPQHYSDRFGWEELAAEVARVADTLPPAERARAVIIARNYGEAGALEYWRDRYRLPAVVSGHNNYYFWAPSDLALDTVIVVGWREAEVRESFADVVHAGTLRHPWALENGLPVWIARGPILSWPVLLANLRDFI